MVARRYNRKLMVSVIGGHSCSESERRCAESVGRVIGEEGAVLVSGGLGGTMAAASRGCREAGGNVIGIIPGENKDDANEYVEMVITTGMGYSRNTLVSGTADIVVALPGKYGTLSEIAFALNAKKPVYGFGTWDIPGVQKLSDVKELRGILRKNRS
ncbi:MAG: TIGR00725 family protein [Candidatus Omnitrophica bacterium]|nr:TIGR00725 family protein [Candidatus Omnitrophota bacterium]